MKEKASRLQILTCEYFLARMFCQQPETALMFSAFLNQSLCVRCWLTRCDDIKIVNRIWSPNISTAFWKNVSLLPTLIPVTLSLINETLSTASGQCPFSGDGAVHSITWFARCNYIIFIQLLPKVEYFPENSSNISMYKGEHQYTSV